MGFLAAVSKISREQSEPLLRENKAHLAVLGTAMAGLYLSATCHRGCRGGDHIIEALGARIYNLAYGANALTSIGLYDEAQSLIRSIGEIGNLLSLSMFQPEKFGEWIASSKPDRIKKFGPAKVRSLLEANGILLMDKDWYSELCESYTHATPQTSPNKYDLERNVCGGIVQRTGVQTVIEQLTNIVAVVSLYFCRYSSLDDIFERLASDYQSLGELTTSSSRPAAPPAQPAT